MKRTDLIRRITDLGAVWLREGGSHTLYKNPRTGLHIAVPRHAEINDHTARSIIRDARAGPDR